MKKQLTDHTPGSSGSVGAIVVERNNLGYASRGATAHQPAGASSTYASRPVGSPLATIRSNFALLPVSGSRAAAPAPADQSLARNRHHMHQQPLFAPPRPKSVHRSGHRALSSGWIESVI